MLEFWNPWRVNLSWCHSLEKIPDLSTLKNLKELRICGFMDSSKITGFVEVTSLELLSISESESIEKLLIFQSFKT